MKKTVLLLLLIGLGLQSATAQETNAYKEPPKEIADMLLAKPTPAVRVDSKGNWMLISERNSYPGVLELGQPEIKVAGLRLNPNNYAPSRQNFVNGFLLKDIKTGREIIIYGLPPGLQAGNISWSPSETKVAFTHTMSNRVDLYVIDLTSQRASKINRSPLNTTLGNAYTWVDDQTILYKAAIQPTTMAPQRPIVPRGPTIQENIGKAAPSVTYQDMIKSPYDESVFEFYATSQLILHKNGLENNIGTPAIISSFSLSPDRSYLLMRTIRKPFSYLVPASGFPSTVAVTDLTGKVLKVLAELPSTEATPSGYDNTQPVPRGFDWRDDEKATITWAEPLDSGLIKMNVPFHDAVYALPAPFTGAAKMLFKTGLRYYGTTWGDSTVALVREVYQAKQVSRISRYNSQTGTMELLYERNLTDAYGNPGEPVMKKNALGRPAIQLTDNGTQLLMNNKVGSSPRGDLPFLSKFDLSTKKNNIIWRCQEGVFELVEEVLDADKLVLLTRRESQREVANYWIKNLVLRIADNQLTQFSNPYPQLDGVIKEKISYKRADGVDLTGDLYLPKNYDKMKDGPLPVLLWAYPREFNSAADAAQVRGSRDKFTLLSWGSPVFFVTQGFAVLDNAEMPIVATSADKKPNDDFVAQLKMNAEAAINKLVDMGVGDRSRVGVGGHSYGAFMTANLLAHTNLFKAGISRSGAYNRTLTPFGFQNEERTYWQAPQLYYEMSPFSYANRIKTPILLVHGEADDNTGTYPINSERLFAAIKGHGGTVRFVYLPYEAHGYRGRENVLHLLWEENEWLNKYVKGVKK
ncbi:MAG: alpha/beta hydrolase family protein [Bacteroidota bacterium]